MEKQVVQSTSIDHKSEREKDTKKIMESDNPRKIVVAGPGTGKTFLFEQAIKKKRELGKTNILAITFIGKLGDALADDLAGLATTKTLHGFARWFVIEKIFKGKWNYYPKISQIIKEDLEVKGVTACEICDENYKARTNYYKTVGDDDVVRYAVKVCEQDESKIPEYDLILVDEYQDFNEVESKFIDLLAKKNEILIVGDDDQALYEFKGSSPKYIREKYSVENTDFESHTLRYCSRCPDVIIRAFHNIVKHYALDAESSERINKEYLCYVPDKQGDSILNPKILLMRGANPHALHTIIKRELSTILENQNIKSVLILGEGRSCRSILTDISKKLKKSGFSSVDCQYQSEKAFILKPHVMEGYKVLESNPILGWRLLSLDLDADFRKKVILSNYENKEGLKNSLPEKFIKTAEKNAKVLHKILHESDSKTKAIADSAIEKLQEGMVEHAKLNRELFISGIISENKFLHRPLANIEITVCSILGAKGLGADIVFLIGFDKGRFPSGDKATMPEICEMLVTLTRAKKRVYLVNTIGRNVSDFLECLDPELYEEV